MKNKVKLTAAAAAFGMGILVLAAGFVVESPDVGTGDWSADDTVTVAIQIGQNGFDPSEITMEKDQPARIVFTRTVEATCAKQIHIPEFGIEATDLPLNVPVAVAVRPTDSGTFTFACAMDMMEGSILVKSG